MTAALPLVVAGAADTARRQAVTAAVGSTPQWFRLADEGPDGDAASGYVTWLLAADEDWVPAATAALAAGAVAVVVDGPRVVTPDQAEVFADRPVVLATRRSHAPQVRTFAALLAGVRDEVRWVEVLVVEPGEGSLDPEAALFDALATLAAAGVEVDAVGSVLVRPGALVAEALAGDAAVHVTCVRSSAAEPLLRIAAFGTFGSLTATAGDPLVAAPGEVVRVDAEGAHAVPTDYRTPRRVALSDVHTALAAGLDPCSLMFAYVPTAALVRQAFSGSSSKEVDCHV